MNGDVVEQRVAGAADEVRRDAAAGEERPEVDRRALDGRVAAAGPLDLGDLEAAALGGLGDRLGLEDVRVERRRPVGERLAVDVERVVGRAVDARPRAGRERCTSPRRCSAAPGSAGRCRSRRRRSSGSSRIVGMTPRSAYFSTRSWRRPSAAKKTALFVGGRCRRGRRTSGRSGRGRGRRRQQAGQERNDAQQDDGADADVRRHHDLLLDEPGHSLVGIGHGRWRVPNHWRGGHVLHGPHPATLEGTR